MAGSARIPGATTSLGVYKLEGMRTYHDCVFQSAVWAVTLEQGPIGPPPLTAPTGLSVSASVTTVKGTTASLISASWTDEGHFYQIEATVGGVVRTTATVAQGSYSTTSIALTPGTTVSCRPLVCSSLAGAPVGRRSKPTSGQRGRRTSVSRVPLSTGARSVIPPARERFLIRNRGAGRAQEQLRIE